MGFPSNETLLEIFKEGHANFREFVEQQLDDENTTEFLKRFDMAVAILPYGGDLFLALDDGTFYGHFAKQVSNTSELHYTLQRAKNGETNI